MGGRFRAAGLVLCLLDFLLSRGAALALELLQLGVLQDATIKAPFRVSGGRRFSKFDALLCIWFREDVAISHG